MVEKLYLGGVGRGGWDERCAGQSRKVPAMATAAMAAVSARRMRGPRVTCVQLMLW